MTAPTMDEAAKLFADPLAYTDEPKLHVALTDLRAHAPCSNTSPLLANLLVRILVLLATKVRCWGSSGRW